MKRYIVFALLLTSFCADAQLLQPKTRNARVQLELGNYASPQNEWNPGFSSSVVNTIGLSFQRNVDEHFGLKLDIQRWHTLQYHYYGHSDFFGKYWLTENDPIGEFIRRANYLMTDVVATYSYNHSHHELYGNLGASLALGQDAYVSGYSSAFDGGLIVDYDWKMKTHLGGVCELGYNYHLAKNRINIGPSLNARYYPGQFSQYTLKLNMGYNFRVR